MELQHSFTIPVPVESAWPVLLDVERLVPCMPGAAVDEVRDNEFDGRVKVKLGPIAVNYRGTAKFLEVDAENRRLVLDAEGKETKGSGSAKATVTAVLTGQGEQTLVEVTTEFAVTGKPAQFGRGAMQEVGGKLIGQFADNLANMLGSAGPAAEPAAGTRQARPSGDQAGDSPAPAEADALNAMDLVGSLLPEPARRVLPWTAAVLAGFLLGRLCSRRRPAHPANGAFVLAVPGPVLSQFFPDAGER